MERYPNEVNTEFQGYDLDTPTRLITQDWLTRVGFKSFNMKDQPAPHWVLWLGDVIPNFTRLDLGIVLTEQGSMTPHEWTCWVRTDRVDPWGNYMALRALRWQREVTELVTALCGQEWDVSNHVDGAVFRPEDIEIMKVAAFKGETLKPRGANLTVEQLVDKAMRPEPKKPPQTDLFEGSGN
jgi:hypothetical protein